MVAEEFQIKSKLIGDERMAGRATARIYRASLFLSRSFMRVGHLKDAEMLCHVTQFKCGGSIRLVC